MGSSGHQSTAEICPNGHISNMSIEEDTGLRDTHCRKCGEVTLSACPKCRAPIPGVYQRPNGLHHRYRRPAHCPACGTAYPWTDRGIQAAIELAAPGLSEADAKQFAESVKSVACDTPQAKAAAYRLRDLIDKLPAAIARTAERMVVEIASGAIAKIVAQRVGP